jgi:hypothetical protein
VLFRRQLHEPGKHAGRHRRGAARCFRGDHLLRDRGRQGEEQINKAEAKAEAPIEKSCFESPAVAPACYDGSPLRPTTASGWVALVEAAVDATVPITFCGSPSGAFFN